MSGDNSYNGWSNRETWLINVHFGDHWETKSDVDDIREFCEESLESVPHWLQDFIDWNIIDWDELKSHVADDEDDEDDEYDRRLITPDPILCFLTGD